MQLIQNREIVIFLSKLKWLDNKVSHTKLNKGLIYFDGVQYLQQNHIYGTHRKCMEVNIYTLISALYVLYKHSFKH